MIKTLQGIGRNKHSPLEKVPFFPNGTPFKVTHLVSKWIHLSLLHHSWSECHKHCPLGSQKPWDLPGLQCASPFRLQEADPSVLHQSCSLALWLQIEVQAVGGTAACGEQRRVMRSGVESLGSLFHGYRWQWLSSWLPGPELLLGSCCCCCCVASVTPLSMEFSRQEYWSECHSLLQGSSQPRDQTWVSCIAGRFFTIWATRDFPQSHVILSLQIFHLWSGTMVPRISQVFCEAQKWESIRKIPCQL